MGIATALEQRASQQWPPSPDSDFWYGPPAMGTSAGVKINAETARQLTAVWRAVTLLSGVVGMLPIKVYRELPDGSKEALPDDPLQKLLRWAPNRWQSAYQWKQLTESHLDMRGNAFSRVERDRIGQPTALIPWHPDSVKITASADRVLYTLTRANGTTTTVPHEDMLHIRGLGEALVGYSPIAQAAESLGVGFAAQSYGARFFGNDSRPGGVLKMPGTLKKESRDNLEKTWKRAHAAANSHSIAVLEDGLEFQAVGIAPEEAQFLQTRAFQIDEIARLFGVPPHMLMQMERATFSNIEHQGQEFDRYTMQPRITNWEQEIKRTLLVGRDDVYVEFNMDAVLRADTKTRAEANAIRLANGSLSPNEWRRMENQNAIEGEGGDDYFMPLNFQTLSQATEGLPELPADEPPPDEDERDTQPWDSDQVDWGYLRNAGMKPQKNMAEPEVRSAASRHRQMRAFRRMFQSVTARVVRRDVAKVRRIVTASDTKAKLRTKLGEHYEGYAGVVSKELHPALRSYAEIIFGIAVREVGSTEEWGATEDKFMQVYADNSGTRYAISSEDQLEALIREAEDIDAAKVAVTERVDEWDETRAEKMASRESVQANGAISRLAYTTAGVATLVWVTIGDNCPLCERLDGKTVKSSQNFVNAGDTVKAEGVSPLTPRRKVSHPPLHQGCFPGDVRVSLQEGVPPGARTLADIDNPDGFTLAGTSTSGSEVAALPLSHIRATTERQFDGNLIVIRTSTGKQLTCTPNHPVLTPDGWLAAGELNVGSHVVSSQSGEWDAAVVGYDEDVPPTIHEVSDAFGRSEHVAAVPVPATAEDFHGDGMDGEVTIVRADRKLLHELDAALAEQLGEVILTPGDADLASLAGASSADESIKGIGDATLCPMCGDGLGLPLGGSHAGSPRKAGLAPTARRDPTLNESIPDEWPGYAEVTSDPVFGLTGKVAPDQIISVDVRAFSGHVYNLHTETGVIVANGIVTHNCDCLVVAG